MRWGVALIAQVRASSPPEEEDSNLRGRAPASCFDVVNLVASESSSHGRPGYEFYMMELDVRIAGLNAYRRSSFARFVGGSQVGFWKRILSTGI